MTPNPTPEEVRASIVPKSDQLNADDLLTGPITVTITGVRKGDRDQPIIVEIDGHRPYKPCKSMRRVLIAHFSDDPKKWVGQQLTLFCDPGVMWAGVKVGGIRISHMSGLESPRTFMQTISRAKRAEITIHPITGLTAEQREFVAEATRKFKEAETLKLLEGYGATLKGQPQTVRDALEPLYRKRQAELSDSETTQTQGDTRE